MYKLVIYVSIVPMYSALIVQNNWSVICKRDGVDEGIHWLVDCVKRNSDIRPPRNQNDNSLS